MMDQRLTASNGRVAHVSLRRKVEAEKYVEGEFRQVSVPVADLLNEPDGKRVRQVLAGQTILVLEEREGWGFVMAAADGYVGYLPTAELSDVVQVTHRVSARATHVYPEADFKSRELGELSMGSRVAVIAKHDRFAETNLGFVPASHLAMLPWAVESDPVTVAEGLIGTPYLWGGNSTFGIDCSGLVQMALGFCNMTCPGDSDMQEAELGTHLPDDAPLKRGDLLFWKGHVAWVADERTLLHANAYHMAVAYEPIDEAIKRIEAQGDGPVTARKRLGGQAK